MILRLLVPAALALVAMPVLAASPFDGTWKTDLSKVKLSQKPDVFLLSGGKYSCKSCVPAYTVPADGAFHAVPGHDYFDAVAVKIDGPNATTISLRNAGKVTMVGTMTISADGKTATMSSKRTNATTGTSSTGTSTATRVAPAPAGAHAVSGSWQAGAIKAASDSGTMQTMKVTGNRLTLSVPTGEGYTAGFDGKPVLQKNDTGKSMVSLKKVSETHIIETDTRGGKVTEIYDMTVLPGGKTMKMTVTDKRDNTSNTFMMIKQ